MDRSLGPIVVLLGVAIVLVGLGVWAGAFSWFGRLPGDLRVDGERSRVFVPITSMLVLSVVATVVVNLVVRWLR